MNDTLVVTMTNLQSLINEGLCFDKEGIKQDKCNEQKIINLYFDGKKIAERNINDGVLGRTKNSIEFDLKYDSNKDYSKEHWASLLGSPTLGKRFFQFPVQISVGLDTGSMLNMPVNSSYGEVIFRRIKEWSFHGFILAVIVVLAFILGIADSRYALRSALCDFGSQPPDIDKKNKNGNTVQERQFRPWSLARCQMAFWFVLVLLAFTSIWVLTGALDTITPSILTLIGIGSGATIGSAMIDVANDPKIRLSELETTEQEMKDKVSEIESKIQALTLAAGVIAPEKTHLEKLETAITSSLSAVREQIERGNSIPSSRGFLNDLLSDQHGGGETGFHRIQMLVWTLILGVIFIYSVWETLAMPVFSTTLLELQGISAGVYLGFKIPDKKI